MDARRKHWMAALGLFLVWVAALGAMAVFSAPADAARPPKGPCSPLRCDGLVADPEASPRSRIDGRAGLPESEVVAAYQILAQVNRQFGNLRSMRRELRRFLAEDYARGGAVTLLDLGSGPVTFPGTCRRAREPWGCRSRRHARSRPNGGRACPGRGVDRRPWQCASASRLPMGRLTWSPRSRWLITLAVPSSVA